MRRSIADLEELFPAEVTLAVDALTRRPGGSGRYYTRVRAVPVGVDVQTRGHGRQQ